MNESENEKPASNNILQGPWRTKKVKIPDNSVFDTHQEMAFIEELSEQVIVQMLYTLAENGINIDSKEFFQHIAFTVESLKSALYEEKGWFHPLTPIIKNISEVSVEDSDSHETITLRLNIDKLTAWTKKMNLDSDEPNALPSSDSLPFDDPEII